MDVDQTADPMLDPQVLDAETVAVSNPAQRAAEVAQARRLAERYRLDYVDMATFQIDSQLFRAIPAELMLRYGFVPARREGSTLVIVVSDPSDLPQIDEIALQLEHADQGDGRARRRPSRASSRRARARSGCSRRRPRSSRCSCSARTSRARRASPSSG